MRKLLIFLWLLVPVGAAAYHYGPGQEHLRSDAAGQAIARARDAAVRASLKAALDGDEAARELWAEAESAYAEALALLPGDKTSEARQLRLEQAKAQMFVSKLPDARQGLETLVAELDADAGADAAMKREARSALANAQYYTTWLMRLEGAPEAEWQAEIDASRQNYKLVAEQALAGSDAKSAKVAQDDLESAIRLARMDIADLQGLPLPSQCKGCGSGRGRGSKGKGKNQGKQPSDARGAGSGPPPDGSGS